MAADEFAPSVAGRDPVSADQADRRSSLSVRDGPIHDGAEGIGAGAEAERVSLTQQRLDEITKGLRYRQSGRVVAALWPLAQQHGMSRLARDTGISREHLYRIFGDASNLKFHTLLSLLQVLGIKLSADSFCVTSE
ncbi:MAG TPA: helix-turn-helix domain-containing protein [Caulobacteraceae bacterium]